MQELCMSLELSESTWICFWWLCCFAWEWADSSNNLGLPMDTSACPPPSTSGVYSLVAEWTNATLHQGCSGVFWDMVLILMLCSFCSLSMQMHASAHWYSPFTRLYHSPKENKTLNSTLQACGECLWPSFSATQHLFLSSYKYANVVTMRCIQMYSFKSICNHHRCLQWCPTIRPMILWKRNTSRITVLTPSYTYDVELYILSCLQGKLIETALTTPLVI